VLEKNVQGEPGYTGQRAVVWQLQHYCKTLADKCNPQAQLIQQNVTLSLIVYMLQTHGPYHNMHLLSRKTCMTDSTFTASNYFRMAIPTAAH